MPERRRVKSRMLSERSSDSLSTTAATAKSGFQKKNSEKVPTLATASILGVGPVIKNKGKHSIGKIQKEPERKLVVGVAKLVHKTNNYYVYEYHTEDVGVRIRFQLPLFWKKGTTLRPLAHTALAMLITFEPQHKPQEVA